MIKKLDHIAIIASSNESISFYEKLGFKETKRVKREFDLVVFMESSGIMLEIFIDARHPKRPTNPETLGLRHFALNVDNFDELSETFGAEKISTDWYGRRFFFISDPDGVCIEINE